MNYMSFSVVDLLQLPDFKLASQLNDEEALKRILWNLGMDTTKEIEWNYCLHRALTTNIPQENYRIEGFERLDAEHIKSGKASLNAIIASSPDPSLRDELISLDSRAASFDEERELSGDIDLDMLDELEALGTSEGDLT